MPMSQAPTVRRILSLSLSLSPCRPWPPYIRYVSLSTRVLVLDDYDFGYFYSLSIGFKWLFWRYFELCIGEADQLVLNLERVGRMATGVNQPYGIRCVCMCACMYVCVLYACLCVYVHVHVCVCDYVNGYVCA